MLGQHKKMRTLEEERRIRMLQSVALAIVIVITLLLVWKALATP